MASINLSNAKITFQYSKKLRVNNSNYCDDSALQESFCADIHDTNWNALNPEDRNARLVDAYCQSGITQDSGADASFYDNYWIQLHDPT